MTSQPAPSSWRHRSVYIAAHRVWSPTTQASGVNVFWYSHGGGCPWPPSPAPAAVLEAIPRTLRGKHVEVEPPGNRVVAYLDVFAPDGLDWDAVKSAFLALVGPASRRGFPWEERHGDCVFRASMDATLASRWPEQLAELLLAAEGVRSGGTNEDG